MSRAKNLTCVRCDETKPRDSFVNDRTRPSGKFPWCKECVLDSRRATKEQDKLRERVPAKDGERTCPGCLSSIEGLHSNRMYCGDPCKDRVRNWRTFGLEPDEYRALIASNDGRCPICARRVKRWALDHNHATGEVTGAICSVCNQTLLAYSRHDLSVAMRLVEYLRNPPLRGLLGEARYVGPETLDQLERIKGWRKTKGYSVGMAQSAYLEDAA